MRQIEAGNTALCEACGEPVKFNSKVASHARKQVIANVYKGRGVRRHWDRVEHFHLDCYLEAGCPHGAAT